MRFSTVEERLYREAIDLVLDGIDRTRTSKNERDRSAAEVLKDWPFQISQRSVALPA
jgi:hypothetical protein